MRNLWRNWSSAQRLAAVIIITVGLASIVWIYTAGTSDTWQVLLETRLGRNSDELSEFLARLDTEEIPWRFNQANDVSKFEIEVRPGVDYRNALLLASENGLVGEAGEAGMDQGLFGGGLTDTPEKIRFRLEQSKIRKVEKAIRRYPSVAFVDLMIKHGREGRFATDKDTADTAVVLLRMKDSAARLGAREAGTIRKIVSSAFAIEGENIQIVDSNMRDYPGGPEELEETLARDLQGEVRNDIREVIEGLYLGVYEKEQFRLGVIVDSIEMEQPGNGETNPGVATNAPGEAGTGTGEQAAGARAGPKSLNPAPRRERFGREVKYRVNVNLILDIGAVKEVLARRDDMLETRGSADFPGRIDGYEREQEEFLARQLPLDNTRVTVKTEAFFKSQQQEAASPPFFPGFFRRGWEFGWLSDPYVYGSGGLALVFLLFCCLLRIQTHRKQRLETEAADAIRNDACRETLVAVDQAGRLARNSPEISTSVVKMWLSESLSPAVEMSNPVADGAESQRETAPNAN